MKNTKIESWVTIVLLSGCVFQNVDGQDADFYVNVAYGKPTSQSSTYLGNPLYNEPNKFHYNASLAVDGNIDTNFHDGSCSHTDVNQPNAWWEVELQGLYEVSSVKIYQRSDANQDWLKGIVVRGIREDNGYLDIYHYDLYAPGVINITLQQKLQFKAIRVQLDKYKGCICLCEVEVFAELNVARGKPTFQSSTYIGNGDEYGHYGASLAVDGNTHTIFRDRSCSQTMPSDTTVSYWKVILNGLFPVIGLRIYQRTDQNEDWLNGYRLYGKQGDKGYEEIEKPRYKQGLIAITPSPVKKFSEIKIELNGEGHKGICLCEVQVFAGIDKCVQPTACNNHGQCFNTKGGFLCHCNTGYTGTTCESDIDECITMPNACHTHGQCYNTEAGFSCRCDTGYTGTLCESDINECATMATSCHNHGQCSNTDGGFSCRCDTGYIGNHCESDIDECTTMTTPCHNHGQCSNTDGGFSCSCGTGYTGTSCESVIRCNELPQPEFGIRLVKAGIEGNWTYHTKVAVECYPGYSLNGDGLVECTNVGQWNGTLGNCSVIRCKEIPQPEFGIRLVNAGIDGNWTYQTTVAVECYPGYSLNGDGLVECINFGQWNGTLGNCSVIRCNELAQPEFGIRLVRGGIEGNWTYHTTVAVECYPGYSLNGDDLVECINFGQWNGTLGNCSAVPVTLNNREPESSVAGVAGGVAAAMCAIILVVIIAFVFYKRRTRGSEGREDKIVDTTLTEMPSSSGGKEHKEKAIREKSIYAKPNKQKHETKTPECDDPKRVYMNSNESTHEYYSFTPQKMSDKHSIRVEDVSSLFLSRKITPSLYEEEYNKLPDGLTEKHTVALLPENRSKNRYKNIYPYDDSRVKLEIWDPSNENDYINACYVNGFKTYHMYIAAQGPTKGILNDFWRMIWQTKCSKIVMLTNLTEEGKHKCEQYWPDENSVEYGDIVVRLVHYETFSDFTIRTLSIGKIKGKANGGKAETHQINQFHFTAWPDRGVPRFASSLVHFRQKIRASNTRKNAEGPMVVHCSAGIGRTGTFLALDYLLDQAEEMDCINVVKCIETLRKQRVNLVQTLEQYIFLHEALLEALSSNTMALSTSEFHETYRKLLERDNKTGKRMLDDEFEKLPMYVSDPEEDVYENAKNMDNRHKNRYSNILPDKNYCPFLNVYVKGRDPYINAVFLPAYKENNIFIITQSPLENTIVDFWRMVYQFEVGSIVMMNALSEIKEEERYWTEDKNTLEIGPFRITLESKSSDDICTNYTMLLNYQDERRRVRLSRATYWADGKPVPMSPTVMLKQIDLVEKWQQESGSKPIIVHCMNGAEKSGLFCVIAALLERTKIEQDVAVEQIIKQMRSRRPQIIPNVDQFKFCYDAMLAYLNQFDTYSNFTG